MKRFKLLTGFLALLLFTACGGSKQVDENPFQLMKEVKLDEIDLKLLEVSEKLKHDTLNPDLYFQRALLYHLANQHEMAYADINKAIKRDSSRASFHSLLGEIFFGLKSSSGAITAFERSVQLDPGQVEPFIRLGEAYLFQGNRSKSFEHLNAALRNDRYNPKVYFLRGMNHKEMGDTSAAITNFNAAVELEPAYYDAYMQLGLIYMARNDRRALASFNHALNTDPSSLEALYARAMYFQGIDSFTHAAHDYEILIKVAPAYRNVNYNMGYVNYMKGNYNEAVKYFSNAIEINPYMVHSYYGRALCYKELNDKTLARKDFLKVQELDPSFEDISTELRNL